MKRMIKITLATIISMYIILEMQSIMLAVYTLSNDLSMEKLIDLEAVAYATAGIGFMLFFVTQGINIFLRNNKKRALIIPLAIAPLIFVAGQLISLSIVENIPSTLSSEQKGIALKSTFALKLSKTEGIAPFFFERDSVSRMDSGRLSSQYYAKLSEREAKIQLLAGLNFISELSAIYKHGQPSGKELRIYRSKYMIDFLNSSIYREFDRRGFATIINMNPIEPNAAIDLLSDIEVFMLSEKLNYEQKILMSKLHIKKKSLDYAFLFFNGKSDSIELDYHFKQNSKTTRDEFSYLLVNGFNVSQSVAEDVARKGIDETLNYGMTQKMFEPVIPKEFKFSPLSIGLSEKQFLNHRFVEQIVAVNAPIMMFKGVEFIPIQKLSNFEYADGLHSGISAGLDKNVIKKVAKMNSMISTEMFKGGFYWDGVWAERALMKKLIPSVSIPIIIGISMLLVLLNFYSVMTLMNSSNAVISISITVVVLGFFFIDLIYLSEAYSKNVMPHVDWIIDVLANIGIKPVN